jgi:hypothetical protein
VQRFTAEFIEAARPCRRLPGGRWFADETYIKVSGRWMYLYRAVDQHGQVIDVRLSKRRDLPAARAFFARALLVGMTPTEVITDRAHAYPKALGELAPAALRVADQYANNRQCCIGWSWHESPYAAGVSDGGSECVEGDPKAVVRRFVGAEFVAAASKVPDERMSCSESLGRLRAFQSAHRPQPRLQPAVIGLDRIVRIPLHMCIADGTSRPRRGDTLAPDRSSPRSA